MLYCSFAHYISQSDAPWVLQFLTFASETLSSTEIKEANWHGFYNPSSTAENVWKHSFSTYYNCGCHGAGEQITEKMCCWITLISLHYKAAWLGEGKKMLLLLKFHVSLQNIFLQESMIALHFLWLLKLKCACLIFFFVPCLGALALFTGVSCSWTFHSCHESSLPLYLPLGLEETRRAGRGLRYRLWCKRYTWCTLPHTL